MRRIQECQPANAADRRAVGVRHAGAEFDHLAEGEGAEGVTARVGEGGVGEVGVSARVPGCPLSQRERVRVREKGHEV